MKPKTIIWRMVIELVVVLATFSAVDMMPSLSESTSSAVQEAVNKKQLETICIVEVRSAIRSASFTRSVLVLIQIAAVILLSSDTWALWQSRRKATFNAEPA